MEAIPARNVPDPRRWWALALLCGAFFMVILDATIVIVALPSIQADIGFSEQGLQWVLSAYALTFGGLLLLGGRAADLLGRRRVFMAGLLFFTAASLLCGLAWSPAALLAARVVQGVGAAIMTPTALSIIATTFPDGSERNKALGIWGALGGIGATAAWLIGGPLVDGPGWEWIFFINIPVGLAALALSPVLLRESRAALTRRSYDPAGALTVTGSLVVLVYAVVEAPDVGWGDVRTILLVAGSAVLLAGFALIESRHRAPLVPIRILRSRTLVGANLVMLLVGAVAVGMPFVLTLYGQQVLGYSAVEFGVGSVVLAVGAAVGAIAAQGVVLKVGVRPLAATGMALMGTGSLLLTQVSVGGGYFGDIFLGLLVFGPGVGLAFVPATVAALAGVAEHESGLASGLSNTALQIGGALGVAIVTTVAVSRSDDFLAANGGANPLVVLNEGFQSAFLAVVVLAAIGVALALLLLGRPRTAPQHLEPAPATSAQPNRCTVEDLPEPARAIAERSPAKANPRPAPPDLALDLLNEIRSPEREHSTRISPAPPAPVVADNTNKRRTEMGKLVISDNVSLDGVIQDPAGDEGFRHGGWVGLIKDRPELNKLALDEALGAEALLLGRRSYEWLARRWPSRSGELADRLNSLPKYVVSSTLDDPDWNNSTVLKGDVPNEVSKLKHELDGEINVPASFQLVHTLIEHDLVDELRLKIFPVVLGAGERLFGATSDKKPMRLVATQTVEGDVAYLTYERVRDA
jgi:EmrB/QacA subfamily drug resistance transporter